MKLTENENEIILTDTPVFFWILGTVLTSVCLLVFVAFIYYAFQNPHLLFTFYFSNNLSENLSSLFSIGLILISSVFVFLLCFSMVLMTKITIKVNRLEKIVEIRRIGLLKKNIKKYFFTQISRFETISRPKDDFTQLALLLANDSKINLEISNLPAAEFSKILEKLNSFITQ